MSHRLSECCCKEQGPCACDCTTGKWPSAVTITVTMPNEYCQECACDPVPGLPAYTNAINFSGSAIAYRCCVPTVDGFSVGYRTQRMGPIRLCTRVFGYPDDNYEVYWIYTVVAGCSGIYGSDNWKVFILSHVSPPGPFDGCPDVLYPNTPWDCENPLICPTTTLDYRCHPQYEFRSVDQIPPCRSPVGLRCENETLDYAPWRCAGYLIPGAPMTAVVS